MSTQPVPMHSQEDRESSNDYSFLSTRYVCFGPFHLDLKKEELFKDGARVKLQAKVYQALLTLLEKPGEIVTREELRARLWPSDARVNYDANVNPTVNKLRQGLGDSSERSAFVDTIPRKGYSFVAKVEFADRPVAHLGPQPPPPGEPSPVTTAEVPTENKASLFRAALTSAWFTAGVVALVIASMLFGAALVLYARH